MKTLLLTAIIGVLPLQAATLGEAIESAKEAAQERETVVATGELNKVKCVIYEATLCTELKLPDAMSSGKRIKPDQGGQLILLIRGKYTNEGDTKASMEIPKIRSAGGKTYEGKELYFKGEKAKTMFISLNPDEEYMFAAYYLLPPDAVIGGKLLLDHGNPFDRKMAEINLNFDQNTVVQDSVVKEAMTDNPFDTEDD